MAIAVDKASIGTPFLSDAAVLTDWSFTTNQTVAANGFIVCQVGFSGSGGPTLLSVSDNGPGLTWTIDLQGHAVNPATPVTAVVSAQAPAGMASGTVITAHASIGITGSQGIGGTSFTGVKTTSPVDGTPVGPIGVSPAAQAWSSGNYTIQAGSVIVAAVWNETNNSVNTPTAPSVEAWEANHVDGFGMVTEYRIESSAGSVPVAGSWGTAAQSTINAVAYLAGVPAAGEAGRQTIITSRGTSW